MIKLFVQKTDRRIDRSQRRIFAIFVWFIIYTILCIPWIGYTYKIVLAIPAIEIAFMIFVYVINERVLTFWLIRKQIALYTIVIILLICGASLITGILEAKLMDIFDIHTSMKLHHIMIKNSILLIYAVFISSVTTFALQNYDDREINIKLTAEKKAMELKFLKTQINPHFLFNALNNIYSLSVTENRLTSDAIMHLSNMLRYVLDNGSEYINIKREVDHLIDFIEFNKICSDNTINVSFESDLKDSNIVIPTMLLQPILENCFKHGDIKRAINISLKTTNQTMFFKTENYIKETKKDIKSDIGIGIGMKNVEKRLKLYFQEEFDLTTYQVGDKYIMLLTIKIENDKQLR